MRLFNRKRVISALLSLSLTAALIPTGVFAAAGANGLNGHWAAGAIETCRSYDIMNGDGDGSYAPDRDITRAEFAAMVNRAFGYNTLTVPELRGYTDVPSGKWYAEDIKTAVALGVITGYGNGTAAPEDKITREQAAVLLSNVLRLEQSGDWQTRYTDIVDASDWAVGSILAMERKGYIVGYENRFMPLQNFTRGEAAQMLSNVFGVIADGNFDAKGREFQNVTVRKQGTVLKNAVIKGDLFITEGVGDGDIWLDTVRIEGRLLAAGGGENSIHVKDITVGENVVVDKPLAAGEQSVRFRAIQTNDTTIVFEGIAREVIITDDIIVIIDMGGEKTVFNLFKQQDDGAKPTVVIDGNAEVGKITTFAPAEISGDGGVGKVEAHTGGVVIDNSVKLAPENVEAEEGVEVKVGGGNITGGGITDPTPKPTDPPSPDSGSSEEPAPAPAQGSGGGSSGGGSSGGGSSGGSSGGSNPPPAPTSYAITVENDGNGTAAASPTKAAQGATVTLTAIPNTSYIFKEWQIIRGGITLSSLTDSTATFTMPRNAVTVKAIFEPDIEDGTQAHPFKVYDPETLKRVGKGTDASWEGDWSLSAYYEQINDIDISGEGNWDSIGLFNGNYDGGGFKVSNLTFSALSADYYGLFFGVGTNGTVKNLELDNVSIDGTATYVGAVAGYSYGTIEDCIVSGSIEGKNGLGGVVGWNLDGTVANCTVDIDIITPTGNGAGDWIGGAVGICQGGSVTGCTVTGSVKSQSNGNHVGGVVGRMYYGEISDCTFDGDVVGFDSVGGIAGVNTYYEQGVNEDKGAAVKRCSSSGTVSSRHTGSGGDSIGGLVGRNNIRGVIEDCYSTSIVSGDMSTGGLVGNNYGSIERCYAAGAVSGGGAAGLAGSHVGDNATGIFGDMQNCIALNVSVTTSGSTGGGFGRVVGSLSDAATLGNNYAWKDMPLNYNGGTKTPVSDAGGVDGADISTNGELAALWTTLGFTGDWWAAQSLPTSLPSTFGADLSLTLAKVTATVVGNGTASAIGTEDGYTLTGETVTVSATPDEGWSFLHWEDESGEIISYDDEYGFIVTDDVTLLAIFSEETQDGESGEPDTGESPDDLPEESE